MQSVASELDTFHVVGIKWGGRLKAVSISIHWKCAQEINVLMRDEKEGRKKQASKGTCSAHKPIITIGHTVLYSLTRHPYFLPPKNVCSCV